MSSTRTRVFVVSAPSGTGKGTLIEIVRELYRHHFGKNLILSVSYTTRPPREGEQEGVQYHFVSAAEFRAMEASREFYETAPFSTRWYGTPKRYVVEAQKLGLDVLLEIEVKGARKLRQNPDFPPFTSAFILPPNRNEQIRRLLGRKQNDPKDLRRRVDEAPEEIRNYRMYDHIVVNEPGKTEQAAHRLFRILAGVEPRQEPVTIKRRVAAILATYNRRKDLNPNHG
jgi:guanylate kinase